MQWVSRQSQISQLLLASLLGLLLGSVIVTISGLGISTRMFVVLVGGLMGLIVMLLTRDVKRLLVLVICVDLTTSLDFHLTCDKDFFLSSCGFNISTTFLALIPLYALWIIDIRRGKDRRSAPQTRLDIIGALALIFLVAVLISIGIAKRPDLAVFQFWIYTVMFLMFFYLSNYIRDRETLMFVVYSLVFTIGLQLLIMELQLFGIIEPASESRMWVGRITGTLITPNRAGGFLMQMLMIMLAVLLMNIPWLQRAGLGIMTITTAHALVGTESRGAWSAAVIGLVVIGVIGVWKRWIGLRALVLALLIIALVGAVVSGQIIARLTQDDRGAAEARGPLAEIANNMIWRNPVTGVGINNFGVVLYDYVEAEQLGAWLHLVHNGWLLIWSETGTIGFAVYAAFRFMLLWQAFRLIRKGDKNIGLLALGLFASMIGGGIHMTVEIYSSRNLIQIIWMDAALVSAMTAIQKQEEAQRASNSISVTKASKGKRV